MRDAAFAVVALALAAGLAAQAAGWANRRSAAASSCWCCAAAQACWSRPPLSASWPAIGSGARAHRAANRPLAALLGPGRDLDVERLDGLAPPGKPVSAGQVGGEAGTRRVVRGVTHRTSCVE
jgi:hypothetical protein